MRQEEFGASLAQLFQRSLPSWRCSDEAEGSGRRGRHTGKGLSEEVIALVPSPWACGSGILLLKALASLESQSLGSSWWWGPVHSIPTLPRPVPCSDSLVEEHRTRQSYLGLGPSHWAVLAQCWTPSPSPSPSLLGSQIPPEEIFLDLSPRNLLFFPHSVTPCPLIVPSGLQVS